MAGIEDLVAQAYAGIGRSEGGEGLAGITQGEKDYWGGQIASGALTPDNFQSAFNAAVNEYRTANPDDPYTQYVNSYQAQQAPTSTGYYNHYTNQPMTAAEAAAFINDAPRVGPTNTAPASNNYFTVNKDVADAYAVNSYGMTPDQFAQYHYNNYGQNEGRADPVASSSTPSSLQNTVNQWFAANPNATSTDIASAVQSMGGLTPELSAILANKYGTDLNTVQSTYDNYVNDKTYTDLVTSAYGTIGRTGVGDQASNIDQAGLNYWKGELAAGRISPDQFNSVFSNAVRQYKTDNPDDPYTQYVNNYQLGQQTDAMKTGITSLLSDNKITLDEANEIQRYVDNYGFNAADIARVTGKPIETINQVLGARSNILGQGYTANSGTALGLADYAITNKLNAKDLSSASGGALTEADAQSLITKAGTTAGRLELASPQAHSQIQGIISRAVNKDYGGKESDWMYKMFTGLSEDETSKAPQQLELTAPRKETRVVGGDEGGIQTEEVIIPGSVKEIPGLRVVETDENGNPTKYVKDIDSKDFNLKPGERTHTGTQGLVAEYDGTGKLLGYSSGNRIYVSDPSYYTATWDATGKATPSMGTTGRNSWQGLIDDTIGGVKDLVGPELWTIAKIVPATAPYVNAADAVQSASYGDWKGAAMNAAASYAAYEGNVASDTGVAGGVGPPTAAQAATMGTAATNAANTRLALATVGAVDAAENGNYTPLLNVAAGVSGLNNNPTVATAFNTMGAVNAAANNDMTGLFNAAGNLTGSKDLKLAAAANNFIEAYNSGNSVALISATSGLTSAAQDNARTSGAVNTVKDFVNGSIQSAKGQAIDVINDLKNSGLTETNTDVVGTPVTTTDTPKYTNVDVQDISSGTQVAGPGGLPENAFKPNGITQTATGLFFTTPEGTSFPISVNKQTGEVTSLDPANAEAVRQLRINDTSGIKPVFFDKTPLDVPMTFDELTELSKVTGKTEGAKPDVTDVQAKDIVSAAKGGASITNLLKMIGGSDTIESAIGIEALMNIPGIKDAMNAGYVNELADHLATDPKNDVWLEEYKKITGMDYVLPSMGVVTITSQREKGNDRVVSMDSEGNEVTLGDILNDMASAKTEPGSDGPPVFPPVVTTTANPSQPPSVPIVVAPPSGGTKTVNPVVSIPPPVIPVDPTVTIPPGGVVNPPVVTNPPVNQVDPTVVTPPPAVTPPTKPATKPASTPSTTTAAQSTGLNFGQVQQALASAGIPQLANVFYYGKDFGGKKQKLDKRGELVDEEYDPLSVTKAGAMGEIEEQVAEDAKTKENDVNTALDHIIGKSSESTSLDDLLNIVKGA